MFYSVRRDQCFCGITGVLTAPAPSKNQASSDATRRGTHQVASDRDRYGIGEWFGHVVTTQHPAQLNELARKAALGLKAEPMPCPFRQSANPSAMCNKPGGVCSMQIHRQLETGEVMPVDSFIAMCPSRLWQDNAIFRWVGETVLGTPTPTVIREVDFLESIALEEEGDAEASDEKKEKKDKDAVGRIDMVLVHPDKPEEWCALELQAVYFSGAAMGTHIAQYATSSIAGLVFPDAHRRPDFRSSGPKRLMPQLQTKVPTLRRWGKKMTVVVDKPFFASLGEMVPVPHLSNSDIAWFVVDYDPTSGAINLERRIYTTLESSVEALTAGLPKSREAFEAKLNAILTSKKKSMKKKVLRLATTTSLSGS